MLDDGDDIVRVAALSKVKAEAEAQERLSKEVLAKIRASMQAQVRILDE